MATIDYDECQILEIQEQMFSWIELQIGLVYIQAEQITVICIF